MVPLPALHRRLCIVAAVLAVFANAPSAQETHGDTPVPRFARRVPGEDRGERVTLATDRYIGFWEAANRPRTIDYPFTVVELRIAPNGEGEGKMSLFTKIEVEKKTNTVIL
jgi:hypothetical protein